MLNALAVGRKTSSRDLKDGYIDVSGSQATVTFTGTLCSNAASDPGPSTCRTNSNPHTGDRGFTVSLEWTAKGSWFVVFGAPAGATPTATASIVSAPPVP